jgi:hypothetical protein
MSAINKLNQGTLTLASSLPFYDPNNGADRRASVSDLAAVLAEVNEAGDGSITQYASPTATGFSVTVTPFVAGGSVFLLLTPAAGYAAGTVVLPGAPIQSQEVEIHCTQAVAALTVSGNGSTVSGAPTDFAAGGFCKFRYDAITRGWYRTA